jgi:hypothetical protein
MSWLDELDPSLVARSTSLEREGVKEVAWDKQTAHLVVRKLANLGYAILGGDVWKKDEHGRWRPAHDNWYLEPHRGEAAGSYIGRSLTRADAYIASHVDPEDGTVGYVIVAKRWVG